MPDCLACKLAPGIELCDRVTHFGMMLVECRIVLILFKRRKLDDLVCGQRNLAEKDGIIVQSDQPGEKNDRYAFEHYTLLCAQRA